MIVVTKWFGVLLCDKESVRKHVLFEKDAKTIAEKLAVVQRGGILEEEERIAEGYKRIRVADARLSKLGKPEMYDSSFIKAEDYGYDMALMQAVMVQLGKMRTREPLASDKGLVQAIRAIDDLIETVNVMSERLHEWYGLHFPELGDYAKDERYADLIGRHGYREPILKAIDVQLESVGAEMLDEDIAAIQDLALIVSELYETKARLDAYVLKTMEEHAPNLNRLLTANLGARLISLAGGLGRLAKLPSSTVQLLGAEKAMFMHLRSGKAPPKHGIIFQHPAIHKAPYWHRGKVARSLASKAAIAARVDFYKGEFIGDKLAEDMEKRINEIKEKYPEPPKRERREAPGRGRHGRGEYRQRRQ
ncbi:MAG: ribosomal biogenesis protein [Methanomassiliicoccales archaeon]|nr:ribosomal biogenesis protein [Methanomassiliicoccales archaeon]